MKSLLLVVLAVLLLIPACKSQSGEAPEDRVWTEAELKALQGKTRDEVRELLGPPRGLYTYDSKGRWHYPQVHLQADDPARETLATVTVYFSQLGEQRATIIEIVPRAIAP